MKPPFNAAMIIPTGIGCAIGGHAGDAGPAARLLASVCDTLLLHPNVVNASDINEMPENSLYVEGGTLDRFFAGEIGLKPVHSNRILVVLEKHQDNEFTAAAINTVNAARATWGCNVSEVVLLNHPPILTADYSPAGKATGSVKHTDELYTVLANRAGTYNAVAIASVIQCPETHHADYFAGKLPVNPWGGVEAILTNEIGRRFNVPCAHAPMLENEDIGQMEVGIVDPRMAAEAISYAFFHCVLKGLHKAPKIVPQSYPQALTVADIKALVIPKNAYGPATRGALKHNIPIISVRENTNLAYSLSEAGTDLYIADNYIEAAGLLACLKAGIDPLTTRRPLASIHA